MDFPALDATTNAYYLPLGEETFQPTLRAQGAWQPYEQHDRRIPPCAKAGRHATSRPTS